LEIEEGGGDGGAGTESQQHNEQPTRLAPDRRRMMRQNMARLPECKAPSFASQDGRRLVTRSAVSGRALPRIVTPSGERDNHEKHDERRLRRRAKDSFAKKPARIIPSA